MQNFISYSILHIFRRLSPSTWIIFIFFTQSFTNLIAQNKIVYHGRDKQKDSFTISTGDKYYDSGGPGGSRLPEQPGNYFNCNDPLNESNNCTSIYTFCASANDTVAINFNDYLIVTGDRLRIFSGSNTLGTVLFNSQNQGVSLNGMRLTTGTLIKSKAINGCITVEMFATTIGNSIGWDADFIIFKKNPIANQCIPICKNNVRIFLPVDTCFQKINPFLFVTNFNSTCHTTLKLFYPNNSDNLNSMAVNMTHAGKRFLFQVSDSIGSSCVGYLTVSESTFSVADCTLDTMSCAEWENNLADIKKVSSCNGKHATVLSSKFTPFDCKSEIIGLITRELSISGDSGQINTCLDSIYIKRTSIDTIQKPGDIQFNCTDLNSDASTLTPGFLLGKYDLDKDYKLDGSGIPIIPLSGGQPFRDSSTFCATLLKYNDLVIPGCGMSYKIRRQWTLTSTCSLIDSVFVQYLTLIDNQPPSVRALESLHYTILPGNCVSSISVDSLLDIKDCGSVNQKLEITYTDPLDPSKQIVINNKLPISLNLPAGPYNLKYTFTDLCFNVSQQNQCLWISKPTDLNLVGDTVISKSVDPNSCFTRVYAKDFESYAKATCKEKLHFAIAHVDTILFYQNYWKNKLSNSCVGQDSALANQTFYNQYIEKWINTNVYSDFIDVAPCEFNKISVKAFDVSLIPLKDPAFECSIHKWISYHTDELFRIYFNNLKKCDTPYSLSCLTEINQQKASGNNKFNLNSLVFLNDSSCRSDYLINEFKQNALTAVSINLRIKVVDTFIPSLPTLPDIIYVENDQFKSECCDKTNCFGETFSPNSWPGKWVCNTCDTSDFIRNFSGPVHKSAVYNSNGYYSYPSCNDYDSIRFFKPIYCRHFINSSGSNTVIRDSLFYTIRLNSALGNEKIVSIKVNCLNSWQLTFTDSNRQSIHCQPDTMIRHWSLKSDCNQSYTFSQKLIIKRRADFEVLFPKDALIDCSAKLIKDSVELWKRFGYPEIHSSSGDCIQITFSDSLLSTSKIDYCLLTQRVWKIVDLAHINPDHTKQDYIVNDSAVADMANRYCVYRNLKEGGDGVMYYKQIITYIDSVPPVIAVKDTIIQGSNCMASAFDMKISVRDDCTPEEVLFSFHSLDLNGDGSYENSYPKEKGVVHFSEGLPPGVHRFRSISTDLCGNVDTTFTNITITDDGAPMALCVQSSVLIPIPKSKSILIYAKDFDAGSLAGCEKGPLKFSFSQNNADSTRLFTCDSVGDKSLSVFITNTSHNQSICSIKLQIVADSICTPSSNIISIYGNVMNPNKAGINKVEIKTNALLMKTTTNENGVFQLLSLIPGQNITLVPDKKDDPLNGISTIDLLIIERHIKGLAFITNPYQLIAADINRSGSITITDLIELRKMILGTITNFSNNKDWIFIPESYKFNDPQAPWVYPETISYNPVTNSLSDVNFIGIKVGDVNNSANLNARPVEKRNSLNTLDLMHSVSYENKFQLHSFYLPTPIPATHAFQLALILPSGSSFFHNPNDVLHSIGDLHSSLKNNLLKLIWTAPKGFDLNTRLPLFTIKTNSPQSNIILSGSMNPFIYSDYGIQSLGLSKSVYQNQPIIEIFPNPSHKTINIRFYLNDLQTEKVSLTNLFGKNYNHLLPRLAQGWNHISLNKNDLGGAGQFFFSISNSQNIKNKKFIVL